MTFAVMPRGSFRVRQDNGRRDVGPGQGRKGDKGDPGDVPGAIGEAVADEINTPGTAANDALLDALADGTPNLPASKITSGVFPPARLGTGTASSATVLYGDGTYRPPPEGGGSTVTETATDGLYEIGAGA